MSAATLDRRLRELEANGTHRIASLADFALWHAHGCPEPVEWDPKFAELFSKAAARSKAHVAEPAL
jgi:hypothetical protein